MNENVFNFKIKPKLAKWFVKSIQPNIRYNVIEGSIRVGKDYISAISFVERIRMYKGKAQLFIVAAASSSLAKNVVGDYILAYAPNSAKRCKKNSADAIELTVGRKKYYILFTGGKNNNTDVNIKGLTIGGAYITEINDLNPNFIQMVIDRLQADQKNHFIYGTLNPKGVNHFFYKDFLDDWIERDNCNYEHVTIHDKPDFDDEDIKLFLADKNPNTVSYKRNYLGMRIDAEGFVFEFDDNNHIYNENEDKTNYKYYYTIMDIGESTSATVFHLIAVSYNINTKQDEIHVLKEYHHINNAVKNELNKKNNIDYIKDYADFIKESISFMASYPRLVLFDGTDMIARDLKKALGQISLGNIAPKRVIKDKESERVKMLQSALFKNQLKIHNSKFIMVDDIKRAEYDDKKSKETGELVLRDDLYNENGHFDALDNLFYVLSQIKTKLL